jgi:hypothetical protein
LPEILPYFTTPALYFSNMEVGTNLSHIIFKFGIRDLVEQMHVALSQYMMYTFAKKKDV